LRQIRSHDLAGHSDLDLRNTLAKAQVEASHGDAHEMLPIVFAVADEAISRRLGAWRLFDPGSKQPAKRHYLALAARLLASGPYRSHLGYYTDEAFLETPDFRRSLEPMLTEMGLDLDGKTIVATMVYVEENSKVRYGSDILLPAEFYQAVARKDSDKSLTFRITDEQLLTGCLLYRGKVVEMNAGEGKTMAAAFPAVLHAVSGRSVHVITANDYLASRDAQWLAPVYESLGISVRAVLSHLSDPERQEAYKSRIVYGPLREFGFDFLRDNLKYSTNELVQHSLDVAIVDEADQALIDEARTPLIVAGAASSNSRSVHRVRNAVAEMIARQAELASGLEKEVRAPGLSTRRRRALMAKLYLADPDNGFLVQQFARDARLRRRVQAMAEAGTSDEQSGGLTSDLDYLVDLRNDLVTLTEKGQELLGQLLGSNFDTTALDNQLHLIGSNGELSLDERRRLGDSVRRRLSRRHNQMNQVYQALRAFLLLERDVDYIVSDGQIVLVDKLTGRTRPDSRYQHGLQSALEAKEHVRVNAEPDILGRISVQGFMQQYSTIAGMTGTALSSRDEFLRAYGLDVVSVPPSNPSRRTDHPPRLYASRQDKLSALLGEVRLCQRVGRPVLIGTLTVEQSEEISRGLKERGVEHRVLNAVNSSDEAQIVRSAGKFGAVTVATNMAGRGTDIILEQGLDRKVAQRYSTLVQELLSGDAGQVALSCPTAEAAGILTEALGALGDISVQSLKRGDRADVLVATNGRQRRGGGSVRLEFGLGLCVIGTEMNESSRIDLQLRGRGGRQGEFGSSRFMLSLEDRPLIVHAFAPPAKSREVRSAPSGEHFFEGAQTERRLRRMQTFAEIEDEVARGVMSDYDQAIERQTLSYYRTRKEVISSDSFHPACVDFMHDRARRLVDHYMPLSMINHYSSQFDRMAEELWVDYGVDCETLRGLGIDALKEGLGRLLIERLEAVRARFGASQFDRIEKLLVLQTSDELWVDHLSRLHDLLLSAQLCSHGHKAATAQYLFMSVEAARRLREEVIDTFLPRLVNFAAGAEGALGTPEASTVEDIHEILV
jgi:preprotein translocase subunit SecA